MHSSDVGAQMIDATLACTDKDFGNNSDIVLNITSGNDANVFWYDGQELWGSPDQVDYESLDTAGYKYTLVVEAMDTPDDGQRNRGVFIVIVQVSMFDNEGLVHDPVFLERGSVSGEMKSEPRGDFHTSVWNDR